MTKTNRRPRESGSSIIEVALLAPWIFFLFVGIFDFGFYAYAAICTQNAARAVALAAAQTSTVTVKACDAALGEMWMLPNIGYSPAATKCAVTVGAPAVTQAQPVNVCVAQLTNTTTSPCNITANPAPNNNAIACGDCALNGAATSQFAVVTYVTIPFVPIPGLLTGQMQISRGAEVRQTTP